jgi:hypothetical protein
MAKDNNPLLYADEIVKVLSGTDAGTARTALQMAIPLLEYRIFNAPAGIFPALPGPWAQTDQSAV